MKKVFFLLAFLAYTLICSAQIDKINIPTDNKLKTKLDSIVHQSVFTFMNNSSRVGISIGIIKNGKQFIYNYGSTQREKPELSTGSTVYELASISKTFASTLLARAVLENKVNLNDDIRWYLKEKYPNLESNGTPITLLNLANLTSGLPNWMPDKDLFGKADPDDIAHILDSVHRKYSRQDFYRDLHKCKTTDSTRNRFPPL